jgi:hypothetical protein
MEKPFDYLIEPCFEEFKSINPHLIFENFKYKFRMVNLLDSENSIPGIKNIYYTSLQVIIDNEPQNYILDNSEKKPIKLEKNDSIYLYVDKSKFLCLQVFSAIEETNESIPKSILQQFKIDGTFGEDINLFLQTNNQQIFETIKFSEQIANIPLPYDPYLEVEIEA